MRSAGLRSTAMLAAFASLAAFSPAYAQDDSQPDDPEQAQNSSEEAIVITGSRIRRDTFTSASPVEIITAEESALEGIIDTAEILQGSTVAAGSTQINNTFNGFVVEGGPGVNTISLRGLGSIRTLVMMNGRRLNPAGVRGEVGAVDLNVIPESMIERIEILKDGASSIYGSDAVAGVINVITRQDLDGMILQTGGMSTFDGGGETFQLNGAWGNTFDRGNVTVSFEYFQRNDLSIGDRDYLSCPQDYLFDQNDHNQRVDFTYDNGSPICFGTLSGTVNRRTPSLARFVQIPGAPANGATGAPAGFQRVAMSFAQVFNITPAGPNRYNEALEAYRNQLADTPTNTLREKNTDAISPVERFSIFATGNYDLGGNNEIYGEVLLNRRQSHQDDWQQLFPTFVASASDPNNPFFGQIADSTVLVPSDADQEIDYYRAIVGFRGDLPFLNGWRYDVYGQFGRSEGELRDQGTLRNRLLDALGYQDLPGNGSDGLVYVGPCTQNAGANCAPFNMFDINYIQSGVLPQAVADYIRTVDVGNTTYEQTLFQGVIDGDVMQLPAGALALALGAEWREESIDDTPSLDSQNNNVFGRTSAGRTVGTDTVYEFFGEAEVPILANMPAFEQLTLNGSARWTHYDSYGENSTYKLGLNWSITPEYRLRGTIGTSYRAPALFELFLANQTGFLSQAQIDPCIDWGSNLDPILQANCAADGIPDDYPGTAGSATIITGGGAGILDAEESDAVSLGFIWTPSFIDLSVALDYFEIEVNNQVAQFGTANILNACYTGVSPDFCTLFTRQLDPNLPNYLGILTVNNSYVNLDQQITRGLDLAARYEHEFSAGTFRVDLDITWTFEDVFNLFSGSQVDFNGEVGDPDFVGNLAFRFDRGDWTYFWDIDMIGKASDTEEFGGDIFTGRQGAVTGFASVPVYYKQFTEATAYHDASIRYQTDTWTFQFGVQNIFGDEPPAVSTGVTRIGNVQLVATQNDLLGRRAFFEVTRRW